jgi:arylsulfatase A-like enzyme
MGFGRNLLLITALVCVCLVLSCGTERRQINLLIIGVDTLRPDHLGCYGYERRTSPSIDRFASEGALFEDAVSQSPWTLPSFASTLTSLYPTQHGAGFLEPGSGSYGNRMRTTFPPLAMILLKAGYSTGAVINAPALAPEFGVDRGFEFYDTTPRWDDRKADATTAEVLSWIDGVGEGPFFMFAHYFDPHVTYEPPAPYDTLFDPGYSGRIGNAFDRDTYQRMAEVLSVEGDPRMEADWNHIRALYDGEIAFTDVAIGDLLAGLEERGLRSNTLVVFLSDHGEEFFDHKGFEHGHTLFDEIIKVPLIFSLPGVIPENMRVGQQVRMLDVTPTILDLLGILPTAHLEGVSLRPLITGDGEIEAVKARLLPHRFAYTESMLYGTEKKSITAHPWKLIYDTVTQKQMLFNLEHDPGEHEDLIDRQADAHGPLEELFFQTFFNISETWYVELAGGSEGHKFDLHVSVPRKPIMGNIKMFRIFDSQGHLVDQDRLRLTEVSENVMRLEGFDLKGSMTIAFKVGPKRVPVSFDLGIDGESALDITRVGENLSAPEEMPVTLKATRRGISKGTPPSRPEPPYILVWHAGFEYGTDTPVELGEDTKRKLRALGYIQ